MAAYGNNVETRPYSCMTLYSYPASYVFLAVYVNCMITDSLTVGISFNVVRLAILREEEQENRQLGRAVDNSPGSFICLGLEVEAMQ